MALPQQVNEIVWRFRKATEKAIWIPQVVAILMLIGALPAYPPGGYYTLLRWICCAVFSRLAYQAFTQKKQNWVWILGIAALLFNPLIPVRLDRETWMFVDVVAITILGVSIFVFKKT